METLLPYIQSAIVIKDGQAYLQLVTQEYNEPRRVFRVAVSEIVEVEEALVDL